MTFEELKEHYWPLLKPYLLPLAIACIGLIFIGYGLISLILPKNSGNTVIFESGAEATSEKTREKWFVDVGGAVVKPGVYQLASDARIKDALIAAGGLSGDANREWVAKYVNLAQKVTDGQKLYIPAKGEENKAAAGGETVLSATSSLININTASSKELDTLAGIGEVTAQKIIQGRPYTSIEELLQKKIVSNKVFQEIKEKIAIY